MTHTDNAELVVSLTELIMRARHSEIDERRDAFQQIYELALELGTAAADAIPVLIEGLHDHDKRIGESAAWALKYCEPESIVPLTECLGHAQALVRERAANALGNIGEAAREPAAPVLRLLLGDSDQEVRRRAAWALGLMHDTDPRTVDPLFFLAAKGSSVDKAAALHAIGNIGTHGDVDLKWTLHQAAIKSALAHDDEDVRRCALYAMESFGLSSGLEVELLIELLKREESIRVVEAVLRRLRTLVASADLTPHVSWLLPFLLDGDHRATLACEIAGAIRPVSQEAVHALYEALDRDGLVVSAARALWTLEGEKCAARILPALDRVFDDDDEGVCDVACLLGRAGLPLLPKLIGALESDIWDLQWAAADALGAVASAAPESQSALLQAIAHPSSIVRAAAAKGLARIGTPAVPALREIVGEQDTGRAPWAAFALGEMGREAEGTLTQLRECMLRSSQPLSGCCAIAIANIAGDPDVIPALIETLRTVDVQAPRDAAARALGSFRPAGSDTIAALQSALLDEDDSLREAAQEALDSVHAARH